MANIKSAKKRIKTINRRKEENKFVKATISTYIKKFKKFLAENNLKDAEAQLKETISYIDSACSKGVLHRNNASRKISRLSSALDKAKKNPTITNVVAEKPKKEIVEKVEKEEVVTEKTKTVKTPAAKKTTKKA